jgi:hypothetical protein
MTVLDLCGDSLDGLSVGDALGAQFLVPGTSVAALLAGRLPDAPWPWTDDTEMACHCVRELREHGGGPGQPGYSLRRRLRALSWLRQRHRRPAPPACRMEPGLARLDAIRAQGSDVPASTSLPVLEARAAITAALTAGVTWHRPDHPSLNGPHGTAAPDLVAWLSRQLPVVEAGPSGHFIADVLHRTWRTAFRAAPWEPHARYFDGVPCSYRECLCTALAIRPGQEDITCMECGFVINADRYDAWTRWAAMEWRHLLQNDREGVTT